MKNSNEKRVFVSVQPTLLPVTIEAYCGRATDGGALAGQIACLKMMEGEGEKKRLNQKEKRENHEFLNPIVGFRAVQAAAVAAGFSNVVRGATCKVGVRPCRPFVCARVCL